MFTALVFLAVLAIQIGAYALWQHIKRECRAAQLREDMAATRSRSINGGAFIGARNRLGEN